MAGSWNCDTLHPLISSPTRCPEITLTAVFPEPHFGLTGRASALIDQLVVGWFLQLRLLQLLETFGQHAEAGEEGGGNADGLVPELLLGQEEE